MRPKTTGRLLPPRMLIRTKRMKSGKLWVGYYYNGRDDSGQRKEIPLGSDLNEAKRKWAQFECAPTPVETGLMKHVFDRYERDILPTKAPRTQKNNWLELARLRTVFDSAPINAITPQHIAQYRDSRKTKDKDGAIRAAPIAANREIALFSHVFNLAREWGFTTKENPVRGIRRNKEQPRDFYADDEVWQAVRQCGDQALQDAMDLAYLSGQRPADVLKFRQSDIQDDALMVRQNKTNKFLRIVLTTEYGRTELGLLIDQIRSRKVASVFMLTTERGQKLTQGMLRLRFVAARAKAIAEANEADRSDLAERIAAFQFRDARAKAASDIDDLKQASRLLGHSDVAIKQDVYRRVGEKVSPTR